MSLKVFVEKNEIKYTLYETNDQIFSLDTLIENMKEGKKKSEQFFSKIINDGK